MNRLFLIFFILFAMLPLGAQARAQQLVQARLAGPTLNVPAALDIESRNPAAGENVSVAIVMRPKSKWHGYWENGGDAGVGMQLQWDLPKGVSAGKLRYPVPGTLIISGFMNYVYERPYALIVDLKIDKALAKGTKLPIKLRADWLACDDRICVPEGDDLSVDLAIGDGKIIGKDRARFDAYRAALPVPLDQKAHYEITGKTIEIAVPFPENADLENPYFFANTANIIEYMKPQMARRNGDMLIIKTGADPFGVNNFGGGPINGVLKFGEDQGLQIIAEQGEVPTGGKIISAGKDASEPSATPGALQILLTLGGAILGGLLLNLMPCVFPILGLKALSLAKMGGDERAAKRDAIAYSIGVILCVLALGGIMLALRAAGEEIGWAFQLQEPRIVMLLLLLMVAVTLNLLGGFQLRAITTGSSLTQKGGTIGSFWTGMLAAIVATPCTGPFMAAAMGAALVVPTYFALMIFAGLGFGLALPYLAIAFVPKLRALMPKSGPWLNGFRRYMAIPMALTAIALLWLLWRLSGQMGLVIGGGAAVTFGILLIFIGNMQKRSSFVPPFMAASLLFLAFIAAMALPREAVDRKSEAHIGLLSPKPYSDALLAKYRSKGDAVFVYFTADWCVTCKINESAAINQKATAAAFERSKVKILIGDYTKRDPELGRALARYGRSGVPLYLYFPAGGEAQILPQILTADMLVNLR